MTSLTTAPVTPDSLPDQVGATSAVTLPGRADTAGSTTLVSATVGALTPVTEILQAPRAAVSSQAGEGAWGVLASTGAGPVLWATNVHPLDGQPNVVASYALFDPARLHAALFNGTDLPGGGPWNNGPNVMPAAQSALIGAFNGGFRFKHIKGGYYTESQVVKPLIDGDATLAIDVNGRIVLGVYGRDLTNDGTWVSMRQNLPPVIDG
ncbi:MAG: hypothetical protein JWN62_1836, partial [Acidimicrobiales bacterium]|nr:hypothetical protein [Acidimicrobiales bacterium]